MFLSVPPKACFADWVGAEPISLCHMRHFGALWSFMVLRTASLALPWVWGIAASFGCEAEFRVRGISGVSCLPHWVRGFHVCCRLLSSSHAFPDGDLVLPLLPTSRWSDVRIQMWATLPFTGPDRAALACRGGGRGFHFGAPADARKGRPFPLPRMPSLPLPPLIPRFALTG